MQGVVGVGVDGEAVPVELFAEGREGDEQVFLAALGVKLRHGTAVSPHNRIVALVDPQFTFEETLTLQNLPRAHMQYPAIDAVYHVFTTEFALVTPETFAGKERGLNIANIAEILFGQDETF